MFGPKFPNLCQVPRFLSDYITLGVYLKDKIPDMGMRYALGHIGLWDMRCLKARDGLLKMRVLFD